MKRIVSAAVILVMLFALCAAVFAYDAKDVKIKVACVGDSITYGATIKNRAVDSYPAQLQTILGDGYDVENFGVNSYCMLKTSDKPYWDHINFKRSADFNPDVVLIMLGTNDSKPYNWEKGKDDLEKTYLEMIAYYKALPSKPLVYVMVPAAAYNEGQYDIPPDVIENEIAPRITKMAQDNGIPYIDIYSATKDMPERFPDNIHPDKDGAGIIAKTVAKALPAQESIRSSLTSAASRLDLGGWSVESVDRMWNKGIFDAHIFGKYTKNITRGEAAMLTVRHIRSLHEISMGGLDGSIKDISGNPYEEEIYFAYYLELIKPKEEGIFDPAGTVTREEMAMAVSKILNSGEKISAEQVRFKDAQDISDEAKEAVYEVYEAGIMKGIDDLVFSPKANVTREQALVILDRVMNLPK